MACALAGGLWILRRFDPNAPDSPYLPCLFRELSGWYCPGCGTTRALHALAHGDLAGVWAMNPLLPVLAVLLPAVIWRGSGRRRAWAGSRQDWLVSARFWVGLIGVYWVARNLPWWPFSLLAPGGSA